MRTEKEIKKELEECRKVVRRGNREGHGAESKKCQMWAHALCWVLKID